MDEEEVAVYGGSLLSKLFGRAGAFLELVALLAICSGNFLVAVVFFVIGLALSYLGYRLAGGRRNPELWRR
jgi:hypothetical protein